MSGHFTRGAYSVSKLATVKMLEFVTVWNPDVRTVTGHPGVIDTAMKKKCNDADLILTLNDSEFLLHFI
jgi:hypothetical protein